MRVCNLLDVAFWLGCFNFSHAYAFKAQAKEHQIESANDETTIGKNTKTVPFLNLSISGLLETKTSGASKALS